MTVSEVTGGLWRHPVLSSVLLEELGGGGVPARGGPWPGSGHRICVGVVLDLVLVHSCPDHPTPHTHVTLQGGLSLSLSLSLSLPAAVITVSTLIMTFSDITVTDNILLISVPATLGSTRLSSNVTEDLGWVKGGICGWVE